MDNVIFDKSFLDHPEQQKTTKNSDISLKQHFTLMKIQLNSVCFVSIFGIAKNFVLFQTIILGLLITEIGLRRLHNLLCKNNTFLKQLTWRPLTFFVLITIDI